MARTSRFLTLIAAAAFLCAASAPLRAQEAEKGLWITCIGKINVLSSRTEIEKAVQFAKKGGFRILFVQVYRGDQAWFNSQVADNSPFRNNLASVGTDPFALLIETAHKEGIEVHAWINTLTLSKNTKAKILEKYGDEILTKDQHGRAAYTGEKKGTLDRFYQKEDQLFLEPGDWRVRGHIFDVVRELAKGYPALDGIHFDYIRYPAAPPYIPGSRFNAVGLSYGYGERNITRFREKSGLNPRKLSFEESQVWDDWNRAQVTGLITDAAAAAREISPKIRISSAVIAAFDRAYFAAYQEWPRWVDDGVVDFVVLMNYSHDSNYVKHMARAASGLVGNPSKIYVGLGAYLMADKPEALEGQMEQCASIGPGGVILFDYDSIVAAPSLKALFDPGGQS